MPLLFLSHFVHHTFNVVLECTKSTAPASPRAHPTNSRCGAQGTRGHRPHAAKPDSDRDPRARPTAPPTRASSRPQTDAPGRGQGTRKAGGSQTPSQRETTPHTDRKAGRPARGARRPPATGREDRPRPTGERGEASPLPPHPSRPPQDHPARGHRNHPPHPQGPQRWRWNNQQPPRRVPPPEVGE
ncbi:acidic proline-rich protein PRP25-like [Entelurus aequoreus]|uniref:acidic proline-rich protein PRP25-like n=1 Tax=Entelurus aequoreus TaxID=161455 RepID=UPI002B1E03B0|nr:acidic proline-rich protein PRP25-like [Entelurus aequoreus]